MASNFVKDMGNQDSVISLSEGDRYDGTSVVDSGDCKRPSITGVEKSDPNSAKVFKYDTSLNTKGTNAQYLKSVDSRMTVTDTQPQRMQSQQMMGHPNFSQEMASAKEFLQNYANFQQPMFAATGYGNDASAFAGSMIPPMLVQQPMQVPASLPGMFQTGFMYQTLPEPKSSYPKPQYFPPFTKGSLIMLSTGGLKPIEELKTDDFIESAKASKLLCLEKCKIAKIQEVPNSTITLIGFAVDNYEKEVLVEKQSDHPFFVDEQGWASCKPDLTLAQYGLSCQQLKVGDVCVFMSDKIDSREQNVTEANKFLTSQIGNTKELPRDGQTNGNKATSEMSYKKNLQFENLDKTDEGSFGQPVGKKAKVDIMGMTSKNNQDVLKN